MDSILLHDGSNKLIYVLVLALNYAIGLRCVKVFRTTINAEKNAQICNKSF